MKIAELAVRCGSEKPVADWLGGVPLGHLISLMMSE